MFFILHEKQGILQKITGNAMKSCKCMNGELLRGCVSVRHFTE